VRVLEQQGFTVDWRQVDSEAELRAALGSRWDVVVSDCTLGRMQGLQLLELASQHAPALPFIFVCEAVGEQSAVALMRAGARDCLPKGSLEHLAGSVRRELEQARQQRQRLAQASTLAFQQRMEAVGRLAGRVAHDLNNLLTVIRGYSGLLIETLPQDDPVRKDLRLIDEAAASAEQLARQLSSCNRPQSWEPEVLSVNHLISQLHETLKGMLGEQAELRTVLADGLWEVEVDPVHLQQILVNLAANARDAMQGGGRLTIETANLQRDGDAVAITTPGMAGGDYVMLTVTDNGCGMDPQTLQRSFDPFFTTRDVHGVSGLGLSAAYGIVKQARGLIWADSESGVGSTFRILMPRYPAAG
jgi:signal transduction histidine kinase